MQSFVTGRSTPLVFGRRRSWKLPVLSTSLRAESVAAQGLRFPVGLGQGKFTGPKKKYPGSLQCASAAIAAAPAGGLRRMSSVSRLTQMQTPRIQKLSA